MSNIFKSLGYNGSILSEQNHTSNCAHIGKGGNFYIAEQIKKLHDRQICFSQLRINTEHKRRQMRKFINQH